MMALMSPQKVLISCHSVPLTCFECIESDELTATSQKLQDIFDLRLLA